MHITILALGSRGDVQPYVALGSGLQSAGHRVRFVTFTSFAGLVAENKFEHATEGRRTWTEAPGGKWNSKRGQRNWENVVHWCSTRPCLKKPQLVLVWAIGDGLYCQR